jgi:hypothetical protein
MVKAGDVLVIGTDVTFVVVKPKVSGFRVQEERLGPSD